MTEPIVKTIEVPCSKERAFNIFTKDFSAWWPKDKHSISAMGGEVAQSVTLEPLMGGALIEIGQNGQEHNWGSVSAFDPYDRISLLWHIGTGAEQATKIDVSFETVSGGTKVTLQHHGWDVLGENADKMREGYNGGWVHVFETCFGSACKAKAA